MATSSMMRVAAMRHRFAASGRDAIFSMPFAMAHQHSLQHIMHSLTHSTIPMQCKIGVFKWMHYRGKIIPLNVSMERYAHG